MNPGLHCPPIEIVHGEDACSASGAPHAVAAPASQLMAPLAGHDNASPTNETSAPGDYASYADAVEAWQLRATPDNFECLFAQWHESGDPKIRERLILMHRNLVLHLARRFSTRGELFEDVIQYGFLGLIHALDHYDPLRGVRFMTFATPNIVGEIRRYFRDRCAGVRVPRRLHELQIAINQKIEALTHELDRTPTCHEIGRALNVQAEEVAEALEMSRILEPLSWDELSIEDEATGFNLHDHVGGPDPDLEALNEHAILAAALDKLPQPQRSVLELAYFEGHSQAEIARRLSVSQMHVSRVQRRALSQLRILMEEV